MPYTFQVRSVNPCLSFPVRQQEDFLLTGGSQTGSAIIDPTADEIVELLQRAPTDYGSAKKLVGGLLYIVSLPVLMNHASGPPTSKLQMSSYPEL